MKLKHLKQDSTYLILWLNTSVQLLLALLYQLVSWYFIVGEILSSNVALINATAVLVIPLVHVRLALLQLTSIIGSGLGEHGVLIKSAEYLEKAGKPRCHRYG